MRGDYSAESGPWCRRCGLPARVEGDPEFGRAVHAGTGEELGPDDHQCAPIDVCVPSVRAARGRAGRVALGFL